MMFDIVVVVELEHGAIRLFKLILRVLLFCVYLFDY